MERSKNSIVKLMTAEEFEREIRDRAKFSHMVFITDHVFIDNADRSITRSMIIRALRKGTAVGAPKWDAPHANWVGKMARIGAGTELTVVCAIRDSTLTVTVVTAYGSPK